MRQKKKKKKKKENFQVAKSIALQKIHNAFCYSLK